LISIGGAGGKRDPGKIIRADLSRTEHDPLLAKTRKLLRKSYGFSTNPKRCFSVPCIYSREQIHLPEQSDVCGVSGLNCAGFGSAVMVTATFGNMAAAYVLDKLGG
jgi:tRNA A37 threonylcarbamoyladenosine dehydratase